MKLDSKTYFDRKKELIGMTADHTSRLNKVLFLPTHIFYLFLQMHIAHIIKSQELTLKPKLAKECNFPLLYSTIIYIKLWKLK